MLKLLQISDIHPNSNATFAGKTLIDAATGKNQSLSDLNRSLEFTFRAATDCDAVIIPGDVFDSVKPTMDEVQVILGWLEAVASEMPVVIIPGNHDMAVSPNMATALEPLKWRSNVFVLEKPGSVLLELNGQHVRIHGLPYPMKGRLLAQEGFGEKSPEEITAVINQGLAAILRSFRTEFEPSVPNVLLAHGSVANCLVGDQPRSLAHDILIPLEELHGFDYCALGHIHQNQQIADNTWYSGSLMRNGFGEERERKGFNLVEITAGKAPKVTFVENPHARRYRTLSAIDLTDELLSGPLDPETVWRFKDALNPGDYQTLKPILERLQTETPLFQLDVELISEDRARDAGMAQCLTMEQALGRALVGNTEADLADMMEKHQLLVEEVRA